jgi:hypothetical protein
VEDIKILLGIMTLVSSVNIMGSDKELIVKGKLLVYIMKSKGPRINPQGAPYFIIPQFENKY